MDLRIGSNGPLVYTVQEQLNKLLTIYELGIPVSITGKFDKATEARVKTYQKSIGLESTGVVDELTSSAITRMTYDFELGLPPVVLQPDGTNHCWAAATSSWLSSKPNRRNLTTQDLVDIMKKIPNAVDLKGSITNSGWLQLKNKFQMNFNGFSGAIGVHGKQLTDFNPSFLLRMLKSKGHLIIAYNWNEFIAHAVVAYGLLVKFDERELRPNYYVKIMDPLSNSNTIRLGREINDFKEYGSLFVFSSL